VEDFQYTYSFVGTGIMPENRETPYSALVRKLGGKKGEMPNAQKKITDEMRFWKTFSLPWGKSIEGVYACHVFVRMTANSYEMSDLVDDIRSGGKKRAREVFISTERLGQIPSKEFMGSLHTVATEFLKEAAGNHDRFWESLRKQK
jgi:hypothetical protein